MLSELIRRFQSQSVDQYNRFHGHLRVLAQETIMVRQDLLQVLDDIALVDLWVALIVSEKPRDHLILEHRLGLWELGEELERFRKMRWSLKIPHQDILDDLKCHVKTLNWNRLTNM